MSTPHVQFEIVESIGFITFNRPEARNAMTWDMYEALKEACDEADRRDDVRVLLLRGAGGKAFVSGTDIGQFTGFRDRQDGIAYERHLDEVVDRLERVSKPTIAQVEGVAVGGGCALAIACDLRYCTPDARFGVPIARTLGNCLSAANYLRLFDLIGPARTKEIMFTGRLIDASEAAALGLVNQVVERDAIASHVRTEALRIAANAPLTLWATKEMVRRLQARRRLPAEEADDVIARCYTSDDFQEGVRAFLEKRPPVWHGR